MKMNTQLMIAAGVLVGGYLLLKSAKAKAAAVLNQISPMNHDNIIATAFQKAYGGGFDGRGTLGTDIYELLHWGE